MPSPFPGMDPYLEGSLWMSVHTQLSVEIARQLTPKLRPKYLVLTPERFVYEMPEEVAITTLTTYPDVGVVPTGRSDTGVRPAALAPPPSLRLATDLPEAVLHISIEIRDMAQRKPVTAIEVLSPTNKRGDGRREYAWQAFEDPAEHGAPRRDRPPAPGERVPARGPLPSAPYFVFVSRIESRPIMDIWSIPIDQPLPPVPVPLRAPDPPVMLDLQQAFSTVYDLGGYDLAVDYPHPPEVPLPPELAAWADERLRAAGLRP